MQVSAVMDEHGKYQVHKCRGRGPASKRPALPQSTREAQGTLFICFESMGQICFESMGQPPRCLPVITLSSRAERSHNSVIPTEAKRSGGTLRFRSGAKTSVLIKLAQGNILHQPL